VEAGAGEDAAAGGASKRRGRARRREGQRGEMAAQEIWAPALAPAARDADALGEKKRGEGREKKRKKRGLLSSNRGRCGVARGREAGERGAR